MYNMQYGAIRIVFGDVWTRGTGRRGLSVYNRQRSEDYTGKKPKSHGNMLVVLGGGAYRGRIVTNGKRGI